MINNLELWDKVRTPDPAATKSFVRAGGFKGTSVSPVYLIRQATEQWGPMGGDWWAEEVETKLECGVWFSKVRLWHPVQGTSEQPGFVEQWGGTQFHVIKKDGTVSYDDEAAKKSYTDALSKCLSWLGFGADVHMGLFDDVKYVNDAAARFDAKKSKGAVKRARDRAEEIGEILEHAESLDELVKLWKGHYNELKSLGEGHLLYGEQIKDDMKIKLGEQSCKE